MAGIGDKVTRKYANFRGVDFRGDECSLNRSPDSLNVWKNYKKHTSIETRPGLKHIHTSTTGVSCMTFHADKLYYISNNGYLHSLNADGTQDVEICYIGTNGVLFKFNGRLYAKGSDSYRIVDTGKEVVPYIPTTSIGRKPAGGGTIHEDVNLLTGRRINTFLGDGKSTEYYLDAKECDGGDDNGFYVKINGENPGGGYTFYPDEGMVEFDEPPPAPATDGQDNVEIGFSKTIDGYKEKIMNCTLVQEFDNRIFFSGNPQYPSVVRHSSLEDPSYISDLDYYLDGADGAPIRSMVAGNNALWVFRDTSEANSSVFYHVPTLDNDYGKVYPSSHSSISLGCVGRAINFNDDIVFFSQRGMEGASTDITTEQFATHRSSMVDRKLTANPKYKDMIFAEWEGYLLVFMGNDVYLADSRAMLTHENHVEYEWYHWKLSKFSVTCATVHNGVLYIGTDGVDAEGHIYTFTRDASEGDEQPGHNGNEWLGNSPIESYWTTPLDRFGASNLLKTTNKKGCVVEATGDVSVYVKVEDTDFELIGTYEDITDYFVSRIKRKKWKDIQLKFHSNTKFSLETATLEAYVGGYIKR